MQRLTLSHFELLRVVVRGGMRVVYQAGDTGLQRQPHRHHSLRVP